MKPIRLFFAIDLPEKVKSTLNSFIMELQKQHSHASIKWCSSNDLHITLHYLASLKIEDINLLIEKVEQSLNNFPSFEIEFGNIELFPSSLQPRVLSLHVKSATALTDIVRAIGEGILATKYSIETRPFRGHITLARLHNIKKDEIFITAHSPNIEKFRVREIILYESKPSSLGPDYIPLKVIQLK